MILILQTQNFGQALILWNSNCRPIINLLFHLFDLDILYYQLYKKLYLLQEEY